MFAKSTIRYTYHYLYQESSKNKIKILIKEYRWSQDRMKIKLYNA
jgi:hypothetical protein